MKKIFITKLFFMTSFIIICLTIFTNNVVKANETESKILKSFEGYNIATEDLINSIPDGKLFEYDATTGKTTELNMEKIRKNAEQKAKKMGFPQGQTKSFVPNHKITDTRMHDSVPYLSSSSFASVPYSLGSSFTRVPNRLQEPYISICKIYAKASNDSTQSMCGTGFLVGSNLLITSAHCVFNKDNNDQKYIDWEAWPAYQAGKYDNLSSGWAKVIYPGAYLEGHGYQNDICLCILENKLGNSVGYMGVSAEPTDEMLKSGTLRSVGYPVDAPGNRTISILFWGVGFDNL